MGSGRVLAIGGGSRRVSSMMVAGEPAGSGNVGLTQSAASASPAFLT